MLVQYLAEFRGEGLGLAGVAEGRRSGIRFR